MNLPFDWATIKDWFWGLLNQFLSGLDTVFRRCSSPTGISVLIILVVLAVVLFFPMRAEYLNESSISGFRAFDGRYPYPTQDVYESLTSLENKARTVYVGSEWWLGFPFMIVVSLLLGAIWVRLLPRVSDKPPFLMRVGVLLPASPVFFDLSENILLSIAVLKYPTQLPLVVTAASTSTLLKWVLVYATIFGILIIGRKFWALLLQYLFFVRVPVLVLSAFYALAYFSGSKDGIPTIINLLSIETCTELLIAAFTVVLGFAIILLTGLGIWTHISERFGIKLIPPPRWLASSRWGRLTVVLCGSIPLLWRLFSNSTATLPSGISRSVSMLGGVALAGIVIVLLEHFRGTWDLQNLVNRARRLAQEFGPGYWDESGGRVHPVHATGLSILILLGILYAAGYNFLIPSGPPAPVATISYILLLLMLVCSLFAGLSFFLDRYRVPLLIAIFIYAAIAGTYVPRDHYFDITPVAVSSSQSARPASSQTLDRSPAANALLPPPSIPDAFKARRDAQRAFAPIATPLITVVAASGGGIQASAWTAQVLAGLQEVLGPEFTRSIFLLSSTSGGSVGIFYFLEGSDPATGVPLDHMLVPIREAAMASSLEATAWGLVFPDFTRVFTPLRPRKDRAWAMEQAWLRTLECMHLQIAERDCHKPPPKIRTRLSDWWRQAERGNYPGVIFNATIVEDGQQFLMSNLDLAPLALNDLTNQPFDPGLWSYGPFDPALKEHFSEQAPFDMDAVTAARLSATFPYVTPVSRARTNGEVQPPAYHVTDGGFFDNFGTVAALRWLAQVPKYLKGERKKARILFIQINAFPREALSEPRSDTGWTYSTLGPIRALLNVRSSTQGARNDMELEVLAKSLCIPLEKESEKGPCIVVEKESENQVCIRLEKKSEKRLCVPLTAVTFQPPQSGISQPLSWELSPKDKCLIRSAWQHPSNQQRIERIRKEFFPDRKSAPVPYVECE